MNIYNYVAKHFISTQRVGSRGQLHDRKTVLFVDFERVHENPWPMTQRWSAHTRASDTGGEDSSSTAQTLWLGMSNMLSPFLIRDAY